MLLILAIQLRCVTASGERERHEMERKKKHDGVQTAVTAATRPSRPAQNQEHKDKTNENHHRKHKQDRKHHKQTRGAEALAATAESKYLRLQLGGTQHTQGFRSEVVRNNEQRNGDKVALKEARPEKVSAASINDAIKKKMVKNNLDEKRHKRKPGKLSATASTKDSVEKNSFLKENKKARMHKKNFRSNQLHPCPLF